MNRKQIIKQTLLACFILIALGGFLLHYRIHPPYKAEEYIIPFISGILSLILLPLLFLFKNTVAYAYVINGMMVIIGTILMTHFSVIKFMGPLTFENIVFKTLLADILLLWGKFAVGKAIFDLELLNPGADGIPKGKYFSYPNIGWWLIHILALYTIYVLGNILWK